MRSTPFVNTLMFKYIFPFIIAVKAYKYIWIAANDRQTEGNWVWGDNTPVDMSKDFWGVARPNSYLGDQDCGIMNVHVALKWDDVACDALAEFSLCEIVLS